MGTQTKPAPLNKRANMLVVRKTVAPGLRGIQLVSRRLPRRTVIFRNHRLRLYTLGWIAYLSNRSVRSLHRWERNGILPPPLMPSPDGTRWYLAAEVKGYSALARAAAMHPGRPAGTNLPRSMWLKANAQAFRSLLKEKLRRELHLIPDKLKDEDEIIRRLAAAPARISTDKLLALLRNNY